MNHRISRRNFCKGAIVLSTAIGLEALLSGCGGDEKPIYRSVVGQVCSVEEISLDYLESPWLFGSSTTITIPVTFLEVESPDTKYKFVLVGEHDIREGDTINLNYLVDNEITGKEIWKRYYPTRGGNISEPNVRFAADGYVHSWKKE